MAADTSETDMKFSNNVEASLHRALTIAQQNFQDPATIEHLLLSLTEDPDALAVLKACAVNIDDLRSDLFEYLSKKPKITVENGADVKPDLQFQRVIERAIFHVKASGLKVVNSSNVLVAMFAERESLAVGFLGKQDVTRYDVVNFVAHGIKKISRTFVSEISTSGQIPKNDPLKKYVFLSYSRSDARIARIIRQELIRQGISIWWDQDIVSGSRWRHEISANLQSASVVLVLWTPSSVKSKSVIEEASVAQGSNKLVHVRMIDAYLPYGFSETQYIDGSNWRNDKKLILQSISRAVLDKIEGRSKEQFFSDSVRIAAISTKVEGGKVAVLDAPVGVGPKINNKLDLRERVRAQITLVNDIKAMVDPTICNLPIVIFRSLERYSEILGWEKLCWYALDDSVSRLCNLRRLVSADEWPLAVDKDFDRMVKRHEEMELLVRPAQPKSEAVVPPLLSLDKDKIEMLAKISDGVTSILEDKETISSITDNSVKILKMHATDLIDDDLRSGSEEHRIQAIQRISKSLIGLSAISGALIMGITSGISANALTSPDAAYIFLERIRTLGDLIFKMF